MSRSHTIRNVSDTYAGPLRGEPLSVELYNTIYASAGSGVDALADAAQAGAWLAAIGARLPLAEFPPGSPPAREDLMALRTAVRSALAAAVDGTPADTAAIAALNAASARAPWSPALRREGRGGLVKISDFHGAS